jgi:glycosyltransferase involved in cell wall biosynthesis
VAVVYPLAFGSNGTYGGGERYALELARSLARRVETRLITFGSQPRRWREGALEIRNYRPLLYARGERFNPVSLRLAAALADVDVVHCVCWNTLLTDTSVLLARALGKKAFVTDVGGGASLTLRRWLPIERLVDGFLLIAEKAREQFAQVDSRARIIYAGIDVERYAPPATEDGRRGVLFVGRLLPHKGINYLIDAVDAAIPLRIVGRPYHEEYFELLRRLSAGKDVTFLTEATDEEVLEEYRSCAVAVLPSVNTTIYGHHTDLPELLGFTAMEAMACGVPVICTRVGGLPELVVDGVTGFLVPPNDPAALAARISQLVSNPELARTMGRAARQRIEERFTWDGVARRCLEAYAS